MTVISPLRPDEIGAVAALERDIEGEMAAGPATLAARREMFPEGFLAARDGTGEIIGYLETCLWDLERPEYGSGPEFFRQRHHAAGAVLYIIFVGVEAAHRRRGVGSELLAAAISLAAGRAVHAVCRDEHLEFYRRAGFIRRSALPGFLPHGEFHLMEYPSLPGPGENSGQEK